MVHELEIDASPDRGLSRRVDTLRALVCGAKSRLPPKYPEVTNWPNGPQSSTCVREFHVLFAMSPDEITGRI
jgi:hypothetical protein